MDSKAKQIVEDYEKVQAELNSPNIYSDNKRLISLSKEYDQNKPLYNIAKKYLEIRSDLEESERVLKTAKNHEDKELYSNIINLNMGLLTKTEALLRSALSSSNIKPMPSILEIRAGTGGEEAALFAQDLLTMYTNFAKQNGWQMNLLSANGSGLGGIKEAIVEFLSDESFMLLRHESGVHRVQRIPATETSGRIHTSAASVVVLPLVDEFEIKINPSELEILTYRSSGPGGQSVNTTDSAIRITHKPSGISVTCQDQKSQHKNKEQAMKILRSKLYEIEIEKRNSTVDDMRKQSIKSGDRSDKIRTYNFPQNRITDHRIKKSWFGIENILNGNIKDMLNDVSTLLME